MSTEATPLTDVCAESCTSGCHASDCEHHGYIPDPIHAEGLCVPCGSPAPVVIAPFPMCRPCAEATLDRSRAEHAALRETLHAVVEMTSNRTGWDDANEMRERILSVARAAIGVKG